MGTGFSAEFSSADWAKGKETAPNGADLVLARLVVLLLPRSCPFEILTKLMICRAVGLGLGLALSKDRLAVVDVPGFERVATSFRS